MKRILLIFTFIHCILSSFSQSDHQHLLQSVEAGMKKDDVFIGMIALKDGSALLISTNDDREFRFRKYDKNFNFEIEKADRLVSGYKESIANFKTGYAAAKYFKSVIQLKDKYFLSFCKMDRNDYRYSFYMQEFDPYEMKMIGHVKFLTPFETMARGSINRIPNMHFGYRNIPNTVNCFYKEIQVAKISPDSSHYLFAYSIPDSASYTGNKMLRYKELEIVSDSEKVHFNVFDNNFKKLWEREVIFKNKIKIEDYALTNGGKIVVLAKTDSINSIYNTNYEIYVFKDDSSKPDTLCPNMVGKSMLDGKFFSPDGVNFNILGTFSDKYYGFYVASIYDTLPHYGERSGDLYRIDKNRTVYLREIIKMQNGKFKAIFEEHGLHTYGNNKEYEARTKKGVIKEAFENLYVMSIDNTGNIEWVTTIPKLQIDLKYASSVYSFLSYKATADTNELRIFYIDNKKNFEPLVSSWKTDYELGRHACLAAVTIGPAGNMKKFNLGKIDKLGSLKTRFYYSKELMYTVNHLNKKNKLYKISLED